MSRSVEGENVEEVLQIASENYEESFRCAIKPVILVCQLFGLFPLDGFHSRDQRKLNFKWKSLRVLYTSIFISAVIISTITNTYKHIRSGGITPENIKGAIFYITASLSCAFFLLVDWKYFFIEWSKVEIIFISGQYQHPPQQMTLKQKVQICFWIGFISFILNQILFFSSTIQKIIYMDAACNLTAHDDVMEEFIVFHLDHIFDVLPYNHAFGIVAEFFNFVMSFYWTFPDIFIMLLSIGISYRFQQINKRIEYFKSRIVSNNKWNEIRLHYTEVCDLAKFVDETFEKLILLAALNNSYLILVQTLHILAWQPFLINNIFNYYSVFLLISKTVAMFLISSTIHESSQRPMKVLRSIPFEGWTDEVERFFDQVRNDTTALSGMGFFVMTKGVFFGLFGAIFTLELILYKYNKVDVTKKSWWTCMT